MNDRQLEKTSDILKDLGLAAMIGSVSDGILSGSSPVADGLGILAALVLFSLSLSLTGLAHGGKL